MSLTQRFPIRGTNPEMTLIVGRFTANGATATKVAGRGFTVAYNSSTGEYALTFTDAGLQLLGIFPAYVDSAAAGHTVGVKSQSTSAAVLAVTDDTGVAVDPGGDTIQFQAYFQESGVSLT